MGLWIQNVGVRAPELPPVVAARTADEAVGVPEPFDGGWTWASLDGDTFLDPDALDELAERAAAEVRAPALAFSVHDSDSVYLVGADAGGVSFRVGLNPAGFEEGAPDAVEGARDAAAWAAEHAPASPTAEELRDVLARHFVFAEEGLALFLARLGLVPAHVAADAAEVGDDDAEEGEGGEEPVPGEAFDFSHWQAEADRELPGERWYATVAGPGDASGRWWVVAFDEERPVEHSVFASAGADLEQMRDLLRSSGLDRQRGFWSYVCAPGEAPRILGAPAPSLAELAAELGSPAIGYAVGEWRPVPGDVPATLHETCAWVASRPR